jgi:hypothetical protein
MYSSMTMVQGKPGTMTYRAADSVARWLRHDANVTCPATRGPVSQL